MRRAILAGFVLAGAASSIPVSVSAQNTLTISPPPNTMRSFESDTAVDKFFASVAAERQKRQAEDAERARQEEGKRIAKEAKRLGISIAAVKRREARRARYDEGMVMASPPPAAEVAAADASGVTSEAITNNQTANVDEGGIVKKYKDYLVVLRRGRLFTVSIANGDVSPVNAIDAFPPSDKKGGGAWYDEMLIAGDMVVVVGFNYARQGTEINRFEIGADGKLTYRDTHHLRSNDYYSSRNYASRLIGNRLIMYTPLYFDWGARGGGWQKGLPALRRWTEKGSSAGFERILTAQNLYVPQLFRDPVRASRANLGAMHSVTSCDLSKPTLDCSATALLGSWSRSFYVSQNAVYVWTSNLYAWSRFAPMPRNHAMLYKIPLDGGAPSAVGAWGGPIDQFSFREENDGSLNVVVNSWGSGDAMWMPETSKDELSLLNVPASAFGDGSHFVGADHFRPLLGSGQPLYAIQNRYVGRHLLYGGTGYGRPRESDNFVNVVSLDSQAQWKVALPHGVTRLDMMGNDAIVIGTNSDNGLGFSAIALEKQSVPYVANTYMLPAAQEGENRSHAFFYRPDPKAKDGNSGILGLPVAKRLAPQYARFLGSGSAITYLNRTDRQLSLAGELEARPPKERVDDNCKASCVDWYGNARPIFLGDRVFALMGYELVEGRLDGSRRISEVRRVDFTPNAERPKQ